MNGDTALDHQELEFSLALNLDVKGTVLVCYWSSMKVLEQIFSLVQRKKEEKRKGRWRNGPTGDRE